MKRKSMILGIMLLGMITGMFYGCKKTEQIAPQKDNSEVFKNAVQQAKQQFDKTAGSTDQSKLKEFVATLKYENGTRVSVDGATVFLIEGALSKVKDQQQFLSVKQKNGELTFDGIYEAKNSEVIARLFATNTLSETDVVTVKNINGTPSKQWLNGVDGKVVYREARPSKVKTLKKLLATLQKTKTKNKTNLVDPGEETGCTYWYYWQYYPGYGWVPVANLGSTGCEGPTEEPSGPPSTPPPPEVLCGLDAAEAVPVLEATEVEAVDDAQILVGLGEDYDPVTDKIREAFIVQKDAIHVKFTLASYQVTYGLFFTGVIYRNGYTDIMNKFESLQYAGAGQTAGTIPPCMDVVTQFIVSPVVIKSDLQSAEAAYFASSIVKIACSQGYQQNIRVVQSTMYMKAN